MTYHNYIDFLPKIPQEIISDLAEIETYDNAFPHKELVDVYASYKVPQKLSDYIQQYFDYDVTVRYQVIKDNLPIHIDIGVEEIKYNYLISTGGDNVKTRFWDDCKNPRKMLHEIITKQTTWHCLNIKIPHEVINVASPRVSITVKRKS